MVRNVYRERDRTFEYKKVADGQRATIQVDAMPGAQFVGHVRTVAAVASQTDWWSSDVKIYQTLVTIEGELLPDGKIKPLEGEQLKPDMTAEVTIRWTPSRNRCSPCRSRRSSAAPRWARRARCSSRPATDYERTRGHARALQREDGRDPRRA